MANAMHPLLPSPAQKSIARAIRHLREPGADRETIVQRIDWWFPAASPDSKRLAAQITLFAERERAAAQVPGSPPIPGQNRDRSPFRGSR